MCICFSEERERRKLQQIIQAAREKELLEKVCAYAFSKAYLTDLKLVVFDNLAENGYFYDPVERDIEEGFLYWLMEEIGDELDLERRARTLLDLMIREVSSYKRCFFVRIAV
ncbi:unnamed protein product [Dicrocoelium dendriticum]|nr:unnamed protein product [Dicrocoelium dendriticum]